MSNFDKIANEKDPFLREVWAMGYDEVFKDEIRNELTLVRLSDKYIKKIPIYDAFGMYQYKIKKAILIDGSIHEWLSEADGSAETFRNYIRPSTNPLL